MTNGKAGHIGADLRKSIDFMAAALAKEKDEFMVAAVIQTFEVTFELAWKFMQAKLSEADGVIVSSPKSSIREFATAGHISEPGKWLDFADLRNLSVHTYQKTLADEMYEKIKNEFPQLAQELVAEDLV